ncbi:MAG: MFS transporter [Deltaproteobacteria bacterium]|nr:MFS transporter [Deltaproteobacteria bacterium]MBI4794482.1 MFS transporter [Deltaproteobacteria bacterium]
MDFVSLKTFAALRHRNFRLFYTGQMISLTGSWMQATAFGWLVLELTNSSFYLGLVGALQTLPVLLFSFLGGVVADHTSKLRLLFITQAALMILALALGVLVELEVIKIWDLCIIVFLSGTVMAFDIPARQAFIVDLVGKPDLPNAIALNSTLFNATRVIGPAVAGVLIAVVGMANCFFLNAVSFLAVLLALFMMHLPRSQPTTWTPFRRAWREVKDHLWERNGLKLVLLIMSAVAILAMPFFVLLPILARDVLGAGPKGFGLLSAGSGLGAFLGGLTLARRLQRRPPMPSFLGGLGLFLSGLIGLGLCGNYYLALVFILLAGFGMVTLLSTGNSLLQLNVPDELRGRIMSLFGLIVMGLSPVGSIFYGSAAHYLGPGLTIAGGSLLAAIVAGVILFRNPELRHLAFTELETAEETALPPTIPPFRG